MILSNKLFTGMAIMLVACLVLSAIAIKKDYERSNTNALYWDYGTVLRQPFRFISIRGGNITRMVYQQDRETSVRVSKHWPGNGPGSMKASVLHDTLYIDFPNRIPGNPKLRDWMKGTVLVRIFSPFVEGISGKDTRLELEDFQQKTVAATLSGNTYLIIEPVFNNIDSLRISATDSSEIRLEPDQEKERASVQIRSAELNIQGNAKMELGSAKVNHLKLDIGDSAIIELSGLTLKRKDSSK